jgi:hypothetical protein
MWCTEKVVFQNDTVNCEFEEAAWAELQTLHKQVYTMASDHGKQTRCNRFQPISVAKYGALCTFGVASRRWMELRKERRWEK